MIMEKQPAVRITIPHAAKPENPRAGRERIGRIRQGCDALLRRRGSSVPLIAWTALPSGCPILPTTPLIQDGRNSENLIAGHKVIFFFQLKVYFNFVFT